MVSIEILKRYKSINPIKFIIDDFCVLTGKNGSGKSHLLEAISTPGNATVIIDNNSVSNIKYIPFNGLNPKIESDCKYLSVITEPKELWKLYLQNFGSKIEQKTPLESAKIFQLVGNIGSQQRPKLLSVLKNILEHTEKKYWDISEDDFIDNYSYTQSQSTEVFSSRFALIFKAYQVRLEKNQYQEYRNNEYGDSGIVLTTEEFENRYGPKPWELINSLLEKAALPYRVNNPEGQDRDSDFHLSLKDEDNDISIKVNDLSTGEKVLMSLALAIYNTNEEGVKPDYLLLDEPDAALHPEFTGLLINSIKESIVDKAGVKVIITTHSPSSVAITSEEFIYKMDKSLGRPAKICKQEAISILTKGISNLKVTVENRRQVFVESKYDVDYYERIYNLIKKRSQTRPTFLPPHSRNGTSCDDVISAVLKLRELGNDLVYGLIDNDNRKQPSSSFIKLLGTRYSIENYIFDPIYIGLALFRLGCLSASDKTVIGIDTYRGCLDATEVLIQNLIQYVTNELGASQDNLILYRVQSGNEFKVSGDFFQKRGHDLEKEIIRRWPQFNEIIRGRKTENILKVEFLETVINDCPEYLSMELEEVLNSFT